MLTLFLLIVIGSFDMAKGDIAWGRITQGAYKAYKMTL